MSFDRDIALRAVAVQPRRSRGGRRAPLPVKEPLLLGRFLTRLVRDGFFEEDGELWAPDGTLIAQSRQLGLLIGTEA